ncbi:MAG: hypothetical protein RBS80_07100 [Thermoguttaceae bacterium]|jgi:tetratricopeptide (TPR) repeat protein|nr:hypothetical protein [Thermoguttaceae bacterium]
MSHACSRRPERFGCQIRRCLSIPAACLAVALAASAVASEAVSEQAAARAYPDVEDALVIFRRGNVDGALTLLQAAKSKHDELPPAEVMLARFHLAHQQPQPAGQLLETATANAPADPEAFLLLAELAHRAGELAKADGLFEQGLQKSNALAAEHPRKKPLTAGALAGLASMAETRQLWSTAVEHLQAWAALEPANPAPVARMARVLFFQEKHDEARASFAQLAKLNEAELPPEVHMGMLFEQTGQRDLAKKEMDAAQTNRPDDAATRLAVTNWALFAGELDVAKANLAAAQKLAPDALAGKLMRGLLHRYQGETEQAEAVFRAVHAESPTNFDATNHLALSLIAQEDEAKHRQALEYAQLNVRTHRDLRTEQGRTAAATLAWVLFRTGNVAAAQQAIGPVVTAGRFPPQTGYYIAAIYHAAGARDFAEKVLAASLKSPRAFPDRKAAEELLAEMQQDAEPPAAPSEPAAPPKPAAPSKPPGD